MGVHFTDHRPAVLKPLDDFVSDIKFLNDSYAHPRPPMTPEEQRLALVAEVRKKFIELQDLDYVQWKDVYIRRGYAEWSRTGHGSAGSRTGTIAFGPDFEVIQDDPEFPISRVGGNSFLRGPWVEGSSVRATIHGVRVKGRLQAFARYTREAYKAKSQERWPELRARLRDLNLQDDQP